MLMYVATCIVSDPYCLLYYGMFFFKRSNNRHTKQKKIPQQCSLMQTIKGNTKVLCSMQPYSTSTHSEMQIPIVCVLGCNRVNDVAKNVALRFPPVAYMLMASLHIALEDKSSNMKVKLETSLWSIS